MGMAGALHFDQYMRSPLLFQHDFLPKPSHLDVGMIQVVAIELFRLGQLGHGIEAEERSCLLLVTGKRQLHAIDRRPVYEPVRGTGPLCCRSRRKTE